MNTSLISDHNRYTTTLLIVAILLLVAMSALYRQMIVHKNHLIQLQKSYVDYLQGLQIEYGFQREHHIDNQLTHIVYQTERVLSSLTEKSCHIASSIKTKNPSVPKSRKTITNNAVQFMWPIKLDRFWLSSVYGVRRKKGSVKRFHYGIDLAALEGTEVCSAQAGVVYQTGYSPQGYGKYIKIKHQKGYETRYAHLSSIMVNKGQRIHKGMIIGKVGSTGAVWGKNASHLHFEVLAATKHVNPLSVLQ